jgi:hypothetical protein
VARRQPFNTLKGRRFARRPYPAELIPARPSRRRPNPRAERARKRCPEAGDGTGRSRGRVRAERDRATGFAHRWTRLAAVRKTQARRCNEAWEPIGRNHSAHTPERGSQSPRQDRVAPEPPNVGRRGSYAGAKPRSRAGASPRSTDSSRPTGIARGSHGSPNRVGRSPGENGRGAADGKRLTAGGPGAGGTPKRRATRVRDQTCEGPDR